MNDLSAIRKAVSSIPISNAKRNIIIKAFSEGGGVTPEEFALVKDDVKTLIDTALTKSNLGKANGVASLDSTGNVPKSQLGNIDTDLFYVVTDLPTTDIKNNKIYLKKSTKTGEENIYTEYAYINNAWEKMGEFKADPDLSGYAKLNGNKQVLTDTHLKKCTIWRGDVASSIDNLFVCTHLNNVTGMTNFHDCLQVYPGNPIQPQHGIKIFNQSGSATQTFATNGSYQEIGAQETFTFTLDDGSTVEKKIRVIN